VAVELHSLILPARFFYEHVTAYPTWRIF